MAAPPDPGPWACAPVQVLAVTGAEAWRPALDEAAAKFRASGAAEADIRTALKNHIKAAELDLGPDPEPEVVSKAWWAYGRGGASQEWAGLRGGRV